MGHEVHSLVQLQRVQVMGTVRWVDGGWLVPRIFEISLVVSTICYFHVHLYLGKISNLTRIFRWVGSTTNQVSLVVSTRFFVVCWSNFPFFLVFFGTWDLFPSPPKKRD